MGDYPLKYPLLLLHSNHSFCFFEIQFRDILMKKMRSRRELVRITDLLVGGVELQGPSRRLDITRSEGCEIGIPRTTELAEHTNMHLSRASNRDLVTRGVQKCDNILLNSSTGKYICAHIVSTS